MKQKILLALGCILMASSAWATDYTLTLYADGCGSPNVYTCPAGQQLSVSADVSIAGNRFLRWNDGSTDNPRLVTMNSNKTLTAYYGSTYTLTIYADGCETPNVYTCSSGQQLSVSAIASIEGDVFARWQDGNTDNPRLIAMTDDMTLTAFFVNHFTVSATSSNDSYGIVSGSGTYRTDSAAVLLATPKYGYHFTQWSDGNTENPRTIQLTKDTTLVAEFAKNIYTFDVTYEESQGYVVWGKTDGSASSDITLNLRDSYGDGWGGCAITLTDGEHSFNCTVSSGRTATYTIPYYGKPYTIRWTKGSDPSECSFDVIFQGETTLYSSLSSYSTGAIIGTIGSVVNSFEYLTDLTLTASPTIGYHFSQWSDGNTENPRTVTLLSDTTLTAVFAPDTFSLTILYNDTMGTVTGAGMYAYGDTAYINSTPNYGYKFKALWYNGRSYNYQNASHRMTKNDTMTVEFEKAEFHVWGYGQNGRVTGTGNYLYLDSATITAKPYVGYLFDSWSDGVTDNPRAIQVTGDTTFTALYVMQYEGECGENLTWQYRDGLLTISGTGDMYHYDYREDYYEAVIRPWRLFRDSIEKVVIEHGVTSIGQSAFYGLQNRAFTKVVMPQSVKSIGYWAFAECNRLTSVVFSSDLEEVGDYAFQNCTRINDMTCYATVTPDAYEHTFDGVNTMAYLYVQAGSARTYKLDPIWGEFDIKEIGAESTTVIGNSVLVDPSDNEAVFTWPMSDGASTYSLNITKDGVVFCTLTFNANGQLTNIAFAPSRDGAQHAPEAILTENGYQFTVTGLDYATHYAFSLNAKDAAAQVVASYTGTFHTNGATALDNVQHDGVQIQKILCDGVLYILTPNGTFDATGRRVEE